MSAATASGVKVFTVESTCPELNKPVTLTERTWTHIQKHPEVHDRLDDIRQTAVAPTYLAKSKSGPGGKYEGNLVAVNSEATFEGAALHVFLQPKSEEIEIGSAWFGRSYHGDIIWSLPPPKEGGDA